MRAVTAASRLFCLFTLLALALPAYAARKPSSPSLKSICDLSKDNVELSIPPNINDGQPRPLVQPILPHPTFVVIAVGVANYTCLPNGTWFSYGAMMELFDVSCVPQAERATFTAEVYDAWLKAPAEMTAVELVENSGRLFKPYALGQHYWVPDPLNETDGSVNPKWDFGSRAWHDALEFATNPETAYQIGYRTGIVTAPNDPDVNIEWVTLAPLVRDGTPLGLFTDQVFRINTNGGFPPAGSCDPKGPIAQSKTVLNFWYYGGYWASH